MQLFLRHMMVNGRKCDDLKLLATSQPCTEKQAMRKDGEVDSTNLKYADKKDAENDIDEQASTYSERSTSPEPQELTKRTKDGKNSIVKLSADWMQANIIHKLRAFNDLLLNTDTELDIETLNTFSLNKSRPKNVTVESESQ